MSPSKGSSKVVMETKKIGMEIKITTLLGFPSLVPKNLVVDNIFVFPFIPKYGKEKRDSNKIKAKFYAKQRTIIGELQ